MSICCGFLNLRRALCSNNHMKPAHIPGTLIAAALSTLLAACGSEFDAAAPQTIAGNTTAPSEAGQPQSPSVDPASQAVKPNSEGYTQSKITFPSCYNPASTSGETVGAHACSWSFNALKLQSLISQRLPLVQSPFIATHNSFNSSAYPGLSSSGDPNHTLSIGDQLALGMSGLELDVHWIFHAASQRFAPVICHGVGASQGHVGCTPQDRLLADGLKEIRAFLDKPESAGTVLLIDIENALQAYVPPNGSEVSIEGHNEAATLMKEILGVKVFLPAEAGKCNSINPTTFTKQQVLDAGKQVVIIGGCGAGTVWPTVVFDMPRKQKANDGFDAKTCEADFFAAADYRSTFTRIWHDSTRLSSVAIQGLKPIDVTELAAMVKCGLHQPSLDQLTVGDPRLPVTVWSWDVAHPKPATSAQCASMASNGRWRNGNCAQTISYACRAGDQWKITSSTGAWALGRNVCEAAGMKFDLPRTAADNLKLNEARAVAKADSVWINWSDTTGQGNFGVPPAQ